MSRDDGSRLEWRTVEEVKKRRGGYSGERLKTSLSHEEVWESLGRDGRGGYRLHGVGPLLGAGGVWLGSAGAVAALYTPYCVEQLLSPPRNYKRVA